MKAQRRHELKENELLHALHGAREYLDRNGKRLGIIVLLAGGAVAAFAINARSRTAAIEGVWRRKAELRFDDLATGRESVAALAAMTEEVSATRFLLDSLVDQGFEALRLAQLAPVPPDEELNATARSAFERLLLEFPDNPLTVGLAHSGLAIVEENEFVLDENPSHRDQAEMHLSAIIEDRRLDGLPFQRLAMDQRKQLDAVFARVRFAFPPEPPKEEAEPGAAEAVGDSAVANPTADVDGLTDPADPAIEPAGDPAPADGKQDGEAKEPAPDTAERPDSR